MWFSLLLSLSRGATFLEGSSGGSGPVRLGVSSFWSSWVTELQIHNKDTVTLTQTKGHSRVRQPVQASMTIQARLFQPITLHKEGCCSAYVNKTFYDLISALQQQ